MNETKDDETKDGDEGPSSRKLHKKKKRSKMDVNKSNQKVKAPIKGAKRETDESLMQDH